MEKEKQPAIVYFPEGEQEETTVSNPAPTFLMVPAIIEGKGLVYYRFSLAGVVDGKALYV